MVPQIAIAGSGNISVSSAQSSASAGSSFTDMLQSMVQSPSAHSSSATSSTSDCAASKPAQTGHSDISANRPADQQKMSEAPTDKDQVSEPATADSRTQEASREQKTAPTVKSDTADNAEDSDSPENSTEHKDDADPLVGLTLLSAIPVNVQPAVVPVNVAPPETGNENAASTAPSTGELPAGTATLSMPGTIATNAGATGVDETSDSVETVLPADAADAEPAAVNGADKEFSDVLNAAAGNATSANENEKNVQEQVNNGLAPAVQNVIQEKLANAAVPQTEPAKETVAAPVVNTDTANAAQAQAASNAVAPAIAAADSKSAVQPAGQKVQAAEGVQTTVDRSKERTSSRQVESESGTKQGSKDNTQFSAVSADTNTVAATQGSKSSESTPQQQDVPLQQTMAAGSHSVKANDSRSTELSASSSLQAAASAAGSAVHTPDTSWMSSVRLMERISQSEMRVGIQSELGDIAVRTAMNRHELSAEISVQHAGLRDAIVAEIPALQSRLSTQHIPMTNVTVTADAGGGANNFQQSAQDGRPASHYSAAANNNDSSVKEQEPVIPSGVLGRSAGLDIRI